MSFKISKNLTLHQTTDGSLTFEYYDQQSGSYSWVRLEHKEVSDIIYAWWLRTTPEEKEKFLKTMHLKRDI